MSLAAHLTELRSRLLRCTLSVIVLGVLSLVFAKDIFQLLMQPVLDALPEDSRSLIYTSGVEEINVLMKVGLYAGIFLTTPIILHQIWQFVAPGLYPSERKFAAPFVALGSIAFLVGAAFCYFVLLPTMFKFLLNEGDSAVLEDRLDAARLREQEALRLLAIGEVGRAGEVAKEAIAGLTQSGEGQVEAQAQPSMREELVGRTEGLGRLYDAIAVGQGPDARLMLLKASEGRLAALVSLEKGDLHGASRQLDEVSASLALAVPTGTEAMGALWELERDLAAGKARYDAARWTKPMLTMREQLSLVLILLLTFGIIFELPIVLALLARLGVVKASFLMKYQRHSFVVCLIAAAVLTPTGDAINLALMAGPMFLCYELGVLAAWWIERQRARQEATTALAPPG